MAEVIERAAWRVCSKCAMAFSSLFCIEKTFVTLTIISDIIKLPQSALAINNILPNTV